eukprot:75895-Amorphochlora_amoeboformis.AAC.1
MSLWFSRQQQYDTPITQIHGNSIQYPAVTELRDSAEVLDAIFVKDCNTLSLFQATDSTTWPRSPDGAEKL